MPPAPGSQTLLGPNPPPGHGPAAVIDVPPGPAPPGFKQEMHVPPGLEYLSQINHVVVRQKVEVFEAICGWETNNKYTVYNSMGQQMFKASEDNDCCTRNCLGASRPFNLGIVDNFGQEAIHLYRPLACASCCFPCCLQTMEVTSPPGHLIGSIEQQWSIIYPKFLVKDAQDNAILRIEGPMCKCSCCGNDVVFKVTSMDGCTQVNRNPDIALVNVKRL